MSFELGQWFDVKTEARQSSVLFALLFVLLRDKVLKQAEELTVMVCNDLMCTQKLTTLCLKKNIPDVFSYNSRKH